VKPALRIPANHTCRSVAAPTLVLAGDATPDFFRDTASRVAELLADAALRVLEGADHGAPAEVVAPAVVEFCAHPVLSR
jgi:pimeloyl-ACP methyl ester carboxylesterase